MSIDTESPSTGVLMTARYINLTDQENIQLVQEVEKRPILYNPSLPAYTRRTDTDRAWEEIGEVMNMTGPLCKERWKNMRVVFLRSLRKGASKKKPYYLANAMKFLIPFTNQALLKTNTEKSVPVQPARNNTLTVSPLADNYGPGIITASSICSNKTAGGSLCTTRSNAGYPTFNDSSTGMTSSVCVKVEHADLDSPPSLHIDLDDFENRNIEYEEASMISSGGKSLKRPHEPLPRNDPVTSFLDSLAPELQEMTFKQFKMFKRRVFTLVDDIAANE